MELVLKTSDASRHRGFESLSLRFPYSAPSEYFVFGLEKYPRGRRGSPAKGVVCDKRSPGSNPGFSAEIRRDIDGFFLLPAMLPRVGSGMCMSGWGGMRRASRSLPRAAEQARREANPPGSAATNALFQLRRKLRRAAIRPGAGWLNIIGSRWRQRPELPPHTFRKHEAAAIPEGSRLPCAYQHQPMRLCILPSAPFFSSANSSTPAIIEPPTVETRKGTM